jgi:hypothetical protein
VHAYRQDDYYAYLKQVFRYVRHKFDLANLPPSPEKLHHVPTEVAHSISLHVLRHLLLTWLKKSIFSITRGDGSKREHKSHQKAIDIWQNSRLPPVIEKIRRRKVLMMR